MTIEPSERAIQRAVEAAWDMQFSGADHIGAPTEANNPTFWRQARAAVRAAYAVDFTPGVIPAVGALRDREAASPPEEETP